MKHLRFTVLGLSMVLAATVFANPSAIDLNSEVAHLKLNDGTNLDHVKIVSFGSKTLMAKWDGGRGTIAYDNLPKELRDAAKARAAKEKSIPQAEKGADGTMQLVVGWSAALVQIENRDPSIPKDAKATLYLNGTPPDGYKAEVEIPALGKSVSVPLRSFLSGDGTRFDPLAKAVVELWVGGSGYNYTNYKQ